MTDYVLSVIIPVYNGENFLRRAVRSVEMQPRSDAIEVLIVDDGSKDGSARLCDAMALEYLNVRVIHRQNGGVASARNQAMDSVQTGYVAFLDADDFWENDFFDDGLCGQLRDDGIDLYGFGFNRITMDLRYYLRSDPRKCREEDTEYYTSCEKGRYNDNHFCSFVYRMDLIRNNELKFLACKVNEDQPFIEMCCYLAESYRCGGKTIFNYWSNPNSCLHTAKWKDYFDQTYRSYLLAAEWYQKRGVPYNYEYSLVMIIDKILPRICMSNRLKQVRTILQTDEGLRTWERYEEIGLRATPRVYQDLVFWDNHPVRYWIRSNTVQRAMLAAKTLITKSHFLRALSDPLFYGRNGYSRTSPQRLKEIRMLSD